MTFLRLLNIQGIAGLGVSLCLALLLVVQKGETRHWKKQSGQFEQLYRGDQAAFAATVANYRTAVESAHADDLAAAQRVAGEQRAINQRSDNAFQSRLADARARAQQLRLHAGTAAADRGGRATAPVSALSVAAGRPAQEPGENRLPPGDALAATEQAIQLDELIKWVKAQAKVDPNAPK
jgi:hypothetical protein